MGVALFACLLCCLLVSLGGAQDLPTANCREYTYEGETFICRCAGGCLNGETPTRTWPGHSDTDRLEIISITRQQHGQNFTCRKVCGNETTEVNYTLQVAYGPDKDSAKITGPIPFSTNGTLSMILMCEAITNPAPDYSWSGVTCDNGNDNSTCIYTPSIQDDGKRATCEVTNAKNIAADSVIVHFDINLWYPPQTAPDILSEGSGSILTAKDILTCTVTGGKPLADSVNFTCTSPYHVIQGNPTNTSVSSSLTIDTSQATTDNMTCYCSANWAPRPEFYTMNSERHFLTEYPPQTAPDIISEGSGSILTAKDILTCTVTGGKPLVDSVNFTCTSPYHVIQGNPTSTSVSSSLTIDTSQATTDNMTCYCSANWAPRPEFYTMKSERNFMTEYPAKVKNFVLNGTNKTVTVTESEHTNVTLQCEAIGRPGPGLLLRKTSHDGTVTLNETHVTSEDVAHTTLDHDITMADWTDMGIYTCIVWNDVGDNDSIPITLNVNSPPRPASKDPEGKHRNRPFIMTTDYKTFLIDLLVYPAPRPENFTYTRYANESDQSGVTVSPDRFNSYVTPSGPGNNFVTVTVTGRKVPDVGVYKVTISNDFGTVEFYFAVNEEIHTEDGGDTKNAEVDLTWILVGVALALILIVIIVVVIICRKRRMAGRRKGTENHLLRTTITNGNTNPAFADLDADSGIVKNGGSSPSEKPNTNPDCTQAPRQSDGAGYASLNEFTPTKQQEGVLRKKSARTAAYEVTSITGGQVSIKQAAPQPNAYQEPRDTKNNEMTLAGAPGGPPTLHNVGPKGDEYAMVSNANNKTTITVGPKGDVYSTVAKHGKGDNTQGSPAKAQGHESAATSQDSYAPLSMTPHALDTPGYATLAEVSPDQGKQGDVTSSSGDAAAILSPVQNTSSSGDGTDTYDHFQRDGHDPKTTSQGPDVQYSHIGSYGKV